MVLVRSLAQSPYCGASARGLQWDPKGGAAVQSFLETRRVGLRPEARSLRRQIALAPGLTRSVKINHPVYVTSLQTETKKTQFSEKS
jgi:hypothetical protein